MDEIAPEYDVIVLGTGKSNYCSSFGQHANPSTKVSQNACFLGKLQWIQSCYLHKTDVLRVLSVKGKKVLHIDRNDHYGGCVSYHVRAR